MKITPNQRFRDGRTTYEAGEEYEVDDLDGARFVGNGWATSPSYRLPGTEPVASMHEVQPDSTRHLSVAKER